MTPRLYNTAWAIPVVLAFCILAVFDAGNIWTSSAQSSPCPTELALRFAPGTTVYVDLDPSFDTSQASQITTALNRWTYANTHGNSSGVTFEVRPLNQVPSGGVILHISTGVLTNVFGAPDPTIRTSFQPVQQSGVHITEATILFNVSSG